MRISNVDGSWAASVLVVRGLMLLRDFEGLSGHSGLGVFRVFNDVLHDVDGFSGVRGDVGNGWGVSEIVQVYIGVFVMFVGKILEVWGVFFFLRRGRGVGEMSVHVFPSGSSGVQPLNLF